MPFSYALSAATGSGGKAVAVNNKGDTMHYDFNLKSNRFCFSGDIDAYRMSSSYMNKPFCFKYDKSEQGLVREYYVHFYIHLLNLRLYYKSAFAYC